MKINKGLKLVTPFSILCLIGIGFSIYYLIAPDPGNWNKLGVYFLSFYLVILFLLDFIMRIFFKDEQLKIAIIQIVLIFIFLGFRFL